MPIHVQRPDGKILTQGEIQAINYWHNFTKMVENIYGFDRSILPAYEFIFDPFEETERGEE